MPRPQTMATWKMPTCALVSTAAQTLPQPKKTSKNVPKNSPIAHFGIGVLATSISAETWGGGSGRVALIVSLILYSVLEGRLATAAAIAAAARFGRDFVILT